MTGPTDEWPPPWIALPDLEPGDPCTQGIGEMYVSLSWYPFWKKLTPEAKADYLDRWNASPRWRSVIAERYDEEGIDWDKENRGQAEAFRELAAQKAARPWWERLFRR